MTHECEACGAEFETLTRLRLHDCGADGTADHAGAADDAAGAGDAGAEGGADTDTTREDAIESDDALEIPDGLDAPVEAAVEGDVGSLHAAVATFEREMDAALDADDPDRYRELFWDYYEPLAHGLDAAARDEGWPLLAEFVEAYDPRVEGDDVPLASPVVANAAGRYVVRTRLAEGVEAVEADALSYLRAVAENADTETPREESFTYGWGIGHPEEDVAATLVGSAEDAYFWTSAALERAFYADQDAAVGVLERLLADDPPDVTVPHPDGEVGVERFFLDAIAGADHDGFRVPRYWDLGDELGYEFSWDGDVAARVRSLASDTGVAAELPDDWTFADLEL
jgi:hypothetical protein